MRFISLPSSFLRQKQLATGGWQIGWRVVYYPFCQNFALTTLVDDALHAAVTAL
jgi:hypothetical protein